VPCERRANIAATTRGHAWVTFPLQIPPMCGSFVVAVARSCPRFRPWFQDGKEGVDGSSPSEGFQNDLRQRSFLEDLA